jgi:Tfp pilus assembly protein PilX
LRTKPNSEKGFILPVVLGVGVITMLLGVMMIERSSQNRVAAIAQKANARSTAAAEHGVTQIQALLNRYPALATACSADNLPPSSSSYCSSHPSWQTISNTVLDPCSTDPTQPIAQIQSYASEPKNSTTDPADGQFQLVSYEYKPDSVNSDIGTGILRVEGKINPDDALLTATTQIEVKFQVTRNPSLGTPPGLWIQDNQAPETSKTTLLTNVRDSTCPVADKVSNPAPVLQGQIQPSYVYQPTPGLAFPKLPLEGTVPTSNTATSSTVPGATSVGPIEGPTPSLPSPAQPQSGSTLTYHIKANSNGQSINLTSPSDVLDIGTVGKNIVLDLEGGLNLTDGGIIRIASGAQLTIYTHGPATLTGNGATPAVQLAFNSNLVVYAHGSVNLVGSGTAPVIEQKRDPNNLLGAWEPSATRAQIYVYPPDTSSESPHEVNLVGSETPLYLSLFAPSSKVTSSAKVQGAIWAKSWEGKAPAAIAQSPIALSDLKLLWPSHISPITAWQVNPQ